MVRVNRLVALPLAAVMAAAAVAVAQSAAAPAARAVVRCGRRDDERARRPAAHGCDARDATVARAPRSHSPRRGRGDHPLRRQHHEPLPAPSADGRAAERCPGGGSAAAPDRDRPGGRTCPPPPVGRAGEERDGARRVEPGEHPAAGASRRPCAPGGRDHVDLAPVADVPGPGSFMAADDRTFGASGGGGRACGDRVRARARGCEGRRDREALPGDRQGDEQHRLVARRDPGEPRCSRERSGAVPRRDRSRRADRHDLERVVSGARLEAGSLVAADPVLAAQRARIQGRHDHRCARRGGRDAGANGAIRGGALRPGRAWTSCCFTGSEASSAAAFERLVAAASEGRIPAASLRRSYDRILALKQPYG